MTVQDIINEAAKQGKFPIKVKCEFKMKHATSDVGLVKEIKPYGIGVEFPGQKWYAWFWAEDQNDKRTKHMGQLTFV